MRILLALFVPVILGFLVAHLLLRSERSAGLLDRLTLSYPLGIGVIAYQMFLLGLFRMPLRFSFILPVIIGEILLLAVLSVIKRDRHVKEGNAVNGHAGGNSFSYRQVMAAIIGVWVVCKLGSVFYETWLRPIDAWDSWANWSARAKAFYYSQSLLLDVVPAEALGKGIIDTNSNYPLLNAMSQVWMALWLGSFDEVLVKFWSPCFLLSASLQLFLVGKRELGYLVAVCIVAIFLSSPLLSLHAVENYSDLPVAVYLLFALTSFWQVTRGKYGYLPVMGIFSTLAMFTKDEALFFVLPLFVTCGYFLWRYTEVDSPTVGKSALRLVSPCVLIVPWFFCKFWYKLGMGADYVTFALTFRPEYFLYFLKCLYAYNNYNIVYFFLPIMLLLNWQRMGTQSLIVLPVICYAVFFVALYMLIKFFAEPLRFSTAILRNSLTYYPSACFLLIVVTKTMSAAPGSETHRTICAERSVAN